MKKNLYLISLIAISLTACKPNIAKFTLETKNFKPNSVIRIQSSATGETQKVENIINDKQTFQINLPIEGYATLTTKNGSSQKEYLFYLDKGEYTLKLDANSETYPFLSSPDEEGQEFINYYKIKDKASEGINDSLRIANIKMDQSNPDNVVENAKNLDKWLEKKSALDIDNIQLFAEKYPNSEHSVYLLDNLGQADVYPAKYLAIYNTLSDEVKESKAGKSLFENIKQVSNMAVGSKMPFIAGETPDGQKFDQEKFLKKVNVIICWASNNTASRKRNPDLVKLYQEYKNNGVEFIGVSLDVNRNWWTTIIKDDQLTWPQFSDLKGAKSPNAKNISDYRISYIFIADKNGVILENDVLLERLKGRLDQLIK